jgi:D-tyrosyl-tRNA(Tyr) deacylase
MKFVIQRVSNASVTVDNKEIASICQGFMVLVGIHTDDKPEQADALFDKLLKLRIFADEEGKLNKAITDIDGEILLVSQFTLYGDCSNGNRPSFIKAMPPAQAEQFYYDFVQRTKLKYDKVQSGIFGADMQVSLVNDGPITIILEN